MLDIAPPPKKTIQIELHTPQTLTNETKKTFKQENGTSSIHLNK